MYPCQGTSNNIARTKAEIGNLNKLHGEDFHQSSDNMQENRHNWT